MLPTDNIVYLKGVGPDRAKVLAAELGVRSALDLLEYFPFRHIDRSATATVASLSEESALVVLSGTMSNMTVVSTGPRRERLTVDFSDGTGTIQLVWFAGTKWVRSKLKPGVKYTVIGKPSFYNGQWQMTHPELETELRPSTSDTQSPTSDFRPPFLPVYNTTDKMKQHGLGTRALARLTETLCSCITSVDETTPLGAQSHPLPRKPIPTRRRTRASQVRGTLLPPTRLSVRALRPLQPLPRSRFHFRRRLLQPFLRPAALPPHRCTETCCPRIARRHAFRPSDEPSSPG